LKSKAYLQQETFLDKKVPFSALLSLFWFWFLFFRYFEKFLEGEG
jgi:hypothetical protein